MDYGSLKFTDEAGQQVGMNGKITFNAKTPWQVRSWVAGFHRGSFGCPLLWHRLTPDVSVRVRVQGTDVFKPPSFFYDSPRVVVRDGCGPLPHACLTCN